MKKPIRWVVTRWTTMAFEGGGFGIAVEARESRRPHHRRRGHLRHGVIFEACASAYPEQTAELRERALFIGKAYLRAWVARLHVRGALHGGLPFEVTPWGPRYSRRLQGAEVRLK